MYFWELTPSWSCVCMCSLAESSLTLCDLMDCGTPGLPAPHQACLPLARPACPSPYPRVCPCLYPLNQWCHPTTISSSVAFLLLPSIFPNIRFFSSEFAVQIRWPKYWSFSVSPSNELISFRIDWFDLLAVQGTLKSLLQHHSSKTSVILGSLPSLW